MVRPPLVPYRFLDPRAAAAAAAARPIAEAVNIPVDELPERTHELPPRQAVVPVVGPRALARSVVEWLRAHGRRATVEAGHGDALPGVTEVGRLWQPTAFLSDVIGHLRPGTALDLACGVGRDAVYLAALGWQVTAVDRLPDALERARRLAGRCAAAIGPIEWRTSDLERETPAFDTPFDLIVGFRFLHRPLFGAVYEWLRPGGHVVYETFTTAHRERHGRPAADAQVLKPGELPRLLGGFELRHHSESWRGDVHTARAWAVKH